MYIDTSSVSARVPGYGHARARGPRSYTFRMYVYRCIYVCIYTTGDGTIYRNYSVAFVVPINMQKPFGHKLLSIEKGAIR